MEQHDEHPSGVQPLLQPFRIKHPHHLRVLVLIREQQWAPEERRVPET